MSDWQTAKVMVIDTETTGVDPATDAIVELGAVTFQGADSVDVRRMVLNPGRTIPAEAAAIHGITDEMVAGKPTLADIGERFLAAVQGADVLCAYNWPFDESFLRAGLGDAWAAAIEGKPVLDPLVIVRKVGRYWKGKGRHKLTSVCERLGIDMPQSHRASADATAAHHVLWHFRDEFPADAHEASEWLRVMGADQDRRFKEWLASQPERTA